MATVSRMREPVLTIPNVLTFSRFFLALVLFVLISYANWIGCIIVFTLAAITDWLDGYIARKQGVLSTLGRNLDPLVDKVLVCGAYVFLMPFGHAQGWMTAWMVTLVVGREMVITGIRSFLENQGAKFGADWLGKVKMVLQCIALFAIFIVMEAGHVTEAGEPISADLRWMEWCRDILIYTMLAATLLSGLQYLWRAAMLFRGEEDRTCL
jgi:CDP-diacylglycerol--glycerol-3-phosphate 3-phosphatidyltransferase